MTLYYAPQYFSTTLNVGGGITAVQTTGIILQSVTGLDITKPGIALLSYSSPLDTSIAEWVTFTSINGSNELQGVTRGAEGYSAKAHANGVSITFPVSKSHINNINDSLNTALSVKDPTDLARQALINGNFDIAQRGTSFVSPTSGTFTLDRWNTSFVGTMPTITISQQPLTTGDIYKSTSYLRLNTNGSGSGFGASDVYRIQQKIENGARFLAGASKDISISFYARSSISSKKLGVSFWQNYGTGGSPSSTDVLTGTNVTLTTNWTRYTFTTTTASLIGKSFGGNGDDYLSLNFVYMWGTSEAAYVGAGSTAETFVGSGNIDITAVNMNIGSTSLDFFPKSINQELSDCQRFYEVGRFFNVTNGTSASNSGSTITFKKTKRIVPTIVQTNISNSGCSATPTQADITDTGFLSFRTMTGAGQFLESWTASAEL